MTKLLSWNHCTKTSDRRRCREIAKFLRYENSELWSQLSSLVQKRAKEKLFSTKTTFTMNQRISLHILHIEFTLDMNRAE